jgi:hypothetical protein
VENFQDLDFEDLEQPAGFEGKCPGRMLYLFLVSIYRFACWELLALWEYLCVIPFHVISLLPIRGTGNHVYRAKHRANMGRLSQVACYFPSFVDVRGRRTGCDFLDLSDGVGLSPSHGTRGGFCRM